MTPSATALPWCRRLVPPCYVPEGDSPLSLLATVNPPEIRLSRSCERSWLQEAALARGEEEEEEKEEEEEGLFKAHSERGG